MVTDERSDQHQPADHIGSFCSGEYAARGAHRVADDGRRAAPERLDHRDDVAGERFVVVPLELDGAVTVAPQVHRRHAVTARDKWRDEMPKRGTNLTHTWDAHNYRPVTLDLNGKPATINELPQPSSCYASYLNCYDT